MHISELVHDAYRHASQSGFHDHSPSRVELDALQGSDWIGLKLALIHSEVTEALEVIRDGHPPAERRFEEDRGKPIGFDSELADIVIRVADLAGACGIDLEKAIKEKLAYNRGRKHMHGKAF